MPARKGTKERPPIVEPKSLAHSMIPPNDWGPQDCLLFGLARDEVYPRFWTLQSKTSRIAAPIASSSICAGISAAASVSQGWRATCAPERSRLETV